MAPYTRFAGRSKPARTFPCQRPISVFLLIKINHHRGRKVSAFQNVTGLEAMTATDQDIFTGESAPLTIQFAPNWPLRTVLFRIAGTALILSASGIWLLPGSQVAADLMLLKFGTAVFFLFCGLALLMRNHEHNQPDAFFDPKRSEVRVMQKNNRGRPEVIMRRSYESLGSVDFSNDKVELFDVDGSLLMKLIVDDTNVRNALQSQLSGQVNVAA